VAQDELHTAARHPKQQDRTRRRSKRPIQGSPKPHHGCINLKRPLIAWLIRTQGTCFVAVNAVAGSSSDRRQSGKGPRRVVGCAHLARSGMMPLSASHMASRLWIVLGAASCIRRAQTHALCLRAGQRGAAHGDTRCRRPFHCGEDQCMSEHKPEQPDMGLKTRPSLAV